MAKDKHPTPGPILSAISDLAKSLNLDPLTAPWPEVAAALKKHLGGDFDAKKAEHRRISLSLGAVIGERLKRESNAFWYAQRDAFGAMGIGYPDVVLSVSPFNVATLALIGRNLADLGALTDGIKADRQAAKAKDPAPRELTPHDYHRFFDPGFVEFFALDRARAEAAWAMPPQRIIAELKDAFFRAQGLSRDGRTAVETQLITALQALDQRKPLNEQAERAPRAVEQVGHLWGAVYGTGVTTEEGWLNVAARLLMIGAPQSPTVPPQAVAAATAAKAEGPVATWLRYQPAQPGAPEGGLLGIFPQNALRTPSARLARVQLRIAALDASALLPLLQKYDANQIRESVKRYAAALDQAVGSKLKPNPQDQALLEEAIGFLDKLRDTLALCIQQQSPFCIRRLTESEATTSGKLGALRTALRN